MTPPQLRTVQDFIALLAQSNLKHSFDTQTQVITLYKSTPPLQGPLTLRWEKAMPFIQVIQPMVLGLPEDRIAALESAISRLNHVSTVPGLGLDHTNRFLYFRYTIRIDATDGIRADKLDEVMDGAVMNAVEFYRPLHAVIQGESPDKVVELAVSQAKAVK